MLQITPQMRLFVAVKPEDFRKGIDGLAQVCREALKSDPFSGAVFVFKSRSAKAIKVLAYDGQGFWLAQKRLSEGRFKWWPSHEGGGCQELEVRELQLLLWNSDPHSVRGAPMWRKVSPGG